MVNIDYSVEYSWYIDFCDPETEMFQCKIGYFTGPQSKELGVFCYDICLPSDVATETSCQLLRDRFCNECNMLNVFNSSKWCDRETGKCMCKDGFEFGRLPSFLIEKLLLTEPKND